MTSKLHQEERRQFERLLHQLRVDRVGDRLAVLEAVHTSEEHKSSEGWQEVLRQAGQALEPVFVDETLELLARWGLVAQRQFDGGPVVYEHQHLGEHHDHLICTRCGSIEEFHHPQLEAMKEEVPRARGFHPLSHRLQIYGLCCKCLAKRQPSLPLTMASAGERLRVERILGGDQAQSHLTDLGLVPGTEVMVISAGGGPLVVAVKGSRVALGRGVAKKVMVTPVSSC